MTTEDLKDLDNLELMEFLGVLEEMNTILEEEESKLRESDKNNENRL